MASNKENTSKGTHFWYSGQTKDGHLIPECSSAFQKSVRRGLVDDAIYFAMQIYDLGFGKYVWKRLKIMVSEDVGIANPNLPANVFALWKMWEEQQSNKNDRPGEAVPFLINAIMLVTMSQKSRVCSQVACICIHCDRKRPVPDYALDQHTARGKKAKRGEAHFFYEGSQVNAEMVNEITEFYKAIYDPLCFRFMTTDEWKPGDGEVKESPPTAPPRVVNNKVIQQTIPGMVSDQ
jgi:replication-associated recombination protein RarA